MMGRGLGFALLAVAAMTALSPLAVSQTRKVAQIQSSRLPLYFPHELHNDLPCLQCHHKVTGVTAPLITLPCVACHRSAKIDLKLSVEPRFHEFCRDCHADRSRRDAAHGPVRDCESCHHPG
jgi:hypothetical protein